MDRHPKISIVTISYNQAEFLEQTLRSVLDQNYPNLEYVVIDGGSKDGSVDIIRKYADRLAYWVSEPDRGPADAINKGFAHTTGEIMGWINSSDVHYPWTLVTLARVFTDVPQAQWITGVATHLADAASPQDVTISYRNVYDFLAGDYAWLQQESTFWRRSLWVASGGQLDPSMKVVFEFELWLRFFKLATLYNVNTILGGFRVHEERIGGSKTDTARRTVAADRFAKFYESFGLSDRLRGRFVRWTDGTLGQVVRAALRRLGMLDWYQHSLIVIDYEAKRWIVQRKYS